jgi:predicted phosphodiesterase
MKTLVFSDVHGNLPAFEKMLKEEHECEAFICLGDLVNYGPWSNECVELALELPNVQLLMGNHEEAFLAGSYPGENVLVQKFFNINYKTFKNNHIIKSFLESYQLAGFICKHTINNQYIYPNTDVTLNNNYIIGHSHHQFKYINNNFALYNAGSVGQNRKFINVIDYLIFDGDTNFIEMKQLVYDFRLLVKEMKDRGFPKECIDYYLQKKTR